MLFNNYGMKSYRQERLRENIEINGLIAGVFISILDQAEDNLDGFEEKLDGTLDDMEELFDNPKEYIRSKWTLNFDKACSKKELKAGDVIAVSRSLPYQHFAVYIGNDEVIHFAAENGDFGDKATIHKAPFKEFLRDAEEFEILEFSKTRKKPSRFSGVLPGRVGHGMSIITRGVGVDLINIPTTLIEEKIRNAQYHLYTPSETVARAKMVAKQCATEGSRIKGVFKGHKYDLVFNNCEHFAIWCKTGVHESRQVDRIRRLFVGIPA